MAVSKVIGKRLGGSFPGAITRTGDQLVQARTIAEIIKFGAPVKFDAVNNQWQNFENGDAETDIVGFAVRAVKQALQFADQSTDQYPANSDADVLTRGFIAVEVKAGTPAPGGQVFVVETVGDSGLEIGDVVATSSIGTGVTVALPTAYAQFTTPKDAVNNTAEVHVLVSRV